MTNSLKKIVIFDDNENILSICSYILEEKGWEVYTFTDCNKIADKVSEIFSDVILMDNWIPDQGGIIATQTLKNVEKLKNIPVIHFSANSEIQSLTNQAAANSFLAKPFDLDELERMINLMTLNVNS